MNKLLSNNESFRRMYMAYFQDGIWDIVLGLWIMLGGILLIADMVPLVAVWVILLVPIVWAGKKRITMPRLTKADLLKVNTQQVNKFYGVLLVGGLVLLVAGSFVFLTFFTDAAWAASMRAIWLFVALSVLVAILVWFGIRFNAPRWYVYAGFVAVLAIVANWFGWTDIPLMMVGIGLLIALGGCIVLIRFLHNHPVIPKGDRPAM